MFQIASPTEMSVSNALPVSHISNFFPQKKARSVSGNRGFSSRFVGQNEFFNDDLCLSTHVQNITVNHIDQMNRFYNQTVADGHVFFERGSFLTHLFQYMELSWSVLELGFHRIMKTEFKAQISMVIKNSSKVGSCTNATILARLMCSPKHGNYSIVK